MLNQNKHTPNDDIYSNNKYGMLKKDINVHINMFVVLLNR